MPRIYVPKVDTWAKAPQEPDAEFEEARRRELATRAMKRRTAAAVVELLGARVQVQDETGLGGRRGTVVGGSGGFLHVCFDDHPDGLETAHVRGDGYVAHVALEDVSVIGADDPERVEYEMGEDYADDDEGEDMVATSCGRSFRVKQELAPGEVAARAEARARAAKGQGTLTVDFRGAYAKPKARQAAEARALAAGGGARVLGARLRGTNEKLAREKADAEAKGVLAQAEATLRDVGVAPRAAPASRAPGALRVKGVSRHGDTALMRWVLLWRCDGVELRLSVRAPDGGGVCSDESPTVGALEHDGGSRGARGRPRRPEPLKARGWFAESVSERGPLPSADALPTGAYTAAVTYVADHLAGEYDDGAHSGDEASILSGHAPPTAVEWRLVFVSRGGLARCELRHGVLELPGQCATGPEMAWEYAAPRPSAAVTGDPDAPDEWQFAMDQRAPRMYENFSNANDFWAPGEGRSEDVQVTWRNRLVTRAEVQRDGVTVRPQERVYYSG